ncbi:MAG: hypothetical protein R2880_08305 [Deinococcales bacterium]
MKHLLAIFFALALNLLSGQVQAHPMPSSMVLLDIHDDRVTAELQIPLADLFLALGKDLPSDPANLLADHEAQLKTYLQAHLKPVSPEGLPWQVQIDSLEIKDEEGSLTGPYQELLAELTMWPLGGPSPRHFTLNYDAVIHQSRHPHHPRFHQTRLAKWFNP